MKPMSKVGIDDANKKAAERIVSSDAVLVDVQPAIKVIPGMKSDTIFHAGPPVEWAKMAGCMKGAIIGAIMFEGLADTPENATRLVETGEVVVNDANHNHQACGPMCGITSPSMPVWIVKNKTYNIDSFQAVYLGSLTYFYMTCSLFR